MADDMMFRMMSKMVGVEPDQFRSIIEGFIHTAKNMGGQMDRIEANQIALIEAENDRRTGTGKPLIGYVDSRGTTHDPNRNGAFTND